MDDPWTNGWDVGDGTTGSGWWNAHAFDPAGRYVVALLMTGIDGTTIIDDATVSWSTTTIEGMWLT